MTIEVKNEINYAALVIEVPEPKKLPNSDRLYGIGVAGIEVVVDSSWLERVGEKAVLFPAESQLSHPLAAHAGLYRHAELNDDPEQVGYLGDNRRIRPLKLRGNMSKGLILPVEKVAAVTNMHSDLFEVGQSFDTVNGIEVSRKFLLPTKGVPQSKEAAKLAKAFKRVDEKVFPMHIDTEFYERNEGHVQDDDIVIVTQKLHGTSVRFGNVPVKVEHTFWERVAKKLGIRVRDHEYDLIAGSRKVIKDPKSTTQNHFYASDVWTKAALDYGQNLPKGFMVFGELVGYTADGGAIQKGYTYEEVLDVDARENAGSSSLYVYRVAIVNEDGVLRDLSWDQVRKFAYTHGLKHTPELWRGPKLALSLEKFAEKNFHDEWASAFRGEEYTSGYLDQPVALSVGGTGKDEGIVLRVDRGGDVPYLLKYKNDSFYLHEAEELDSGEETIEA
ncbi:RNA ligase [Microbacterium Phage DejaVu]|nr:RNA ligase [Microbacterium Phage DejaVu]